MCSFNTDGQINVFKIISCVLDIRLFEVYFCLKFSMAFLFACLYLFVFFHSLFSANAALCNGINVHCRFFFKPTNNVFYHALDLPCVLSKQRAV